MRADTGMRMLLTMGSAKLEADDFVRRLFDKVSLAMQQNGSPSRLFAHRVRIEPVQSRDHATVDRRRISGMGGPEICAQKRS